MKPFWILILCFAGFLPSNAESKNFSKAMIYYVPFQFETYEAVTPENIREKANYKFELNDGNKVAELVELISRGEKTSTFDKKRVRLLVVLDEGKRQIMVDAEGCVIEGKTQRVLKVQQFEQLKKILSELLKANGK